MYIIEKNECKDGGTKNLKVMKKNFYLYQDCIIISSIARIENGYIVLFKKFRNYV